MTTSALALKPVVKTVVIADDSAFVRDRFRTALQNAGHRAVTVRSAAELLARVRADLADIDLLVVDLRLPHGSGPELVRAIRRIDDGQIPVLVFSGTISSADEIRALASLGVAGYVNEYSAVQHILPSLAPHLFPDSFNRRGGRRVLLGIPVAYRHKTTVAAALTLNLSKGGIAVRTASPLALGSRVRARFRLPGSTRDIDADTRVAWCDRQAGMGLNFEKLDPADKSEIDAFIDAHFTDRKR
jgi:two-component system, cell cycle response regulator DivK